jgi:glycine cleavage system H protein
MQAQVHELVKPFVTNDYEWILFDEQIAYVGVCDLKLKGLSSIQRMEVCDLPGKIRQGSVLARVISGECSIPVHMPVDGWLMQFNPELVHAPSHLLDDPAKNWIAKILPARHTIDLMPFNQYFRRHRLPNG